MVMDPSIPPAPPAPNGTSATPFDFIVNPGQPVKKPLLFGGGGSSSTTKRLVIAASGAVIILLVAVVFFSILGSSGKGNVQKLLDLANQQQEIIRVAGLGLAQSQVSTPDTQNLAITTQLSLQSDQSATLALLAKDGQKVTAKNLGLKKDTATDAQLSVAAQNGTYDKTFVQSIDNDLTSYGSALQAAYKSTKSTSEKQVLQTSYNNVALLLGDPAVKNN